MNFLKLLKKNKEVEPQTYDAVYGSLIQMKIRERYTLSAELAILRQRDSKPEEFTQYNEFAEACKAEVKREIDEATGIETAPYTYGPTDTPIPSESEQNSNEL